MAAALQEQRTSTQVCQDGTLPHTLGEEKHNITLALAG